MSDQIGKISDQKKDLKGQMSCYERKMISSTVISFQLQRISPMHMYTVQSVVTDREPNVKGSFTKGKKFSTQK